MRGHLEGVAILDDRNVVHLRPDELQAKWQAPFVKAGRNADRRQAGQIGRDR